MLGHSWVAAQLAASQEGLSSVSEWVSEDISEQCITSNFRVEEWATQETAWSKQQAELASLMLHLWRWKQYIFQKHQLAFTGWCGAMSQQMEPFISYFCVHRSPLLVPIVSQMNPLHILRPHIFKICFNIVLPPVPLSLKWPLPFTFSTWNEVCKCPAVWPGISPSCNWSPK
jgi:hypothetical protein